jgi:hypothetical protein
MNVPHLAVLAALIASPAFAQTNTFPSSGNVGIGTTTPSAKLQVTDAQNASLNLEKAGLNTASIFNDGSLHIRSGSGVSYYDADFHVFSSLNGAPLFRIEPNGNVGIGTDSPAELLELRSSSAVLTFHTPGIASFKLGNDGNIFKIAAMDNGLGGHSGSFANNDTQVLSMTASGNIGIGTTSPRSRLDIGGSVGAGKGARFGDYLEINERELINNSSSLGWNAYITADDGTYGPVHAPGTGMVLTMSSGGYGDLDFWGTNWAGSSTPKQLGSFNHVMRLSTNGNVGIGTSSPMHKLAVHGTIKAKEVIVETTGWSDYVFAEDYALAPLAEVEAHIKEHKHLPGIPSAAHVADHGVSVGEMQAKLLAKIEELTLHQIAQEKELAALRTKVARLEGGAP